MFEFLFGSKGSKAGKAKPAAAATAPAKAKPAARPRVRRVNLARRFTIIAETGQGSMSRIYRAMENATGRTVCLKVQDKAKTAAALARSAQGNRPTEGEVGLKIVHPNVVRTYEWGQTNKGEYYIIMEFIDGQSLQFVRQSRVLTLAEKVNLLAQSAEGLAAVHAAGFLHHDFGPKNLLVDREDRLRLIDFGLSVPNTPEFRRPGNRTGTLQYMAPEVIRREPKDERLDIFAWGVTAFEFLTGRLPYDDAPDPMVMMRQRMNLDPMELARVAPQLPAPLCDLVQATLSRRKENRWARMDKLAEALRELAL
jgi:serine/threonine protein kinase